MENIVNVDFAQEIYQQGNVMKQIFEDADITKQKPVGNIHKIFKGLSELVTDSDAFILTFPKKANAVERIMLIGAVIMIDYRFYEDLACCDCISIL